MRRVGKSCENFLMEAKAKYSHCSSAAKCTHLRNPGVISIIITIIVIIIIIMYLICANIIFDLGAGSSVGL